jgi:hypothetical protein
MGANWWTRDDVINTLDERIIYEVRTGTGKIKAWADDPFNNDPNEGTEWRSLLALRADPVTGAAPFSRASDWDVDGDGMPAFWELAHGLDPSMVDNNGDFDGDSYTNLEEYINEIAAWPAPAKIVFTGATNSRYAQITNWDVNNDPLLVGVWQPSRYDAAVLTNGTVVVDAQGQHAGDLSIAPNADNAAMLEVNAGWLEVAGELEVGGAGFGTVNHIGGAVAASAVVLGAGPAASGVYNLLEGAVLRVATLSKGSGAGLLNFAGGVLTADEVAFDLINAGGVIAPGKKLGTTHVQGDLIINAGSIAIELGGIADGAFDQVVIDGMLRAGGRLEVTLADGFVPRDGDVFNILSFSHADGAFELHLPPLAPGQAWSTEELLTTGELAVVASTASSADFDEDGDVDGADFLTWQRGLGLTGETNRANGDANADGNVNGADLDVWQTQFTAPLAVTSTIPTPEPTSFLLLAAAPLACFAARRRRL